MHRVNYTLYSKVSLILYIISVPLLLYTLFFGVEVNDASRWIRVPVINLTIQTSDFAKLALFMYISRLLSRKQNDIKDFRKGFLPVIIPVLITCALIMPANLSNALLTGATSLLLMFIGRVSFKHILLVIAVALIPVLLIVSVAVTTYSADKTADVKHHPYHRLIMLAVSKHGLAVYRILFMPTIQKFLTRYNNKILLSPMAEFYLAEVLATACSATIFRRLITIPFTRLSLKNMVYLVERSSSFVSRFSFPLHKNFQTLSIRLWCISRSGTQFHAGNTGSCEYGSGRKSYTGNRRNASAREHGRQFIPVHVRIDWYYTQCCKKPGTDGREGTRSCTGDKRTCSSVIF